MLFEKSIFYDQNDFLSPEISFGGRFCLSPPALPGFQFESVKLGFRFESKKFFCQNAMNFALTVMSLTYDQGRVNYLGETMRNAMLMSVVCDL